MAACNALSLEQVRIRLSCRAEFRAWGNRVGGTFVFHIPGSLPPPVGREIETSTSINAEP